MVTVRAEERRMGKKVLAGPKAKISAWQEEEDEVDDNLDDAREAPLELGTGCTKTSRQRIEEYLERKRLAEALQEEVGDNILRP